MFVIPSLKGLSVTSPSSPPGEGLTFQSGIQSLYGTSGLTILNPGGPVDEDWYPFQLPFPFYLYGTNYSTLDNSIVTNGYMEFGIDTETYFTSYYKDSTDLYPGLFFMSADQIMNVLAVGQGPTINGVNSYIIHYDATDYETESNTYTLEIIFYSDNKIQINYGTFINLGQNEYFIGISNSNNNSVFEASWGITENASTSVALSSDANGANWTAQYGYWG